MNDVQQLAHLVKRNGAWLIMLDPNVFEYATQNELCDCAGSLAVAKRLARSMVTKESDQEATHLRWQEISRHTWNLLGRYEAQPGTWID